jgi:hypothetical protein
MGVHSIRFWGRLSAAPKNYAQDLGWKSRKTSNGVLYTGYYRAYGLRYEGSVLKAHDGKLTFLIRKPPIELLRDTEFGGCFHAADDGWWLVAYKPWSLPADAPSGIAAIQKTLLKAFEIRAEKRRSQY